jgi:serine transporter
MGIGLYLAPDWNGAILDQVPTAGQFSLTLWLSIPALVFSFNHSPAISRFVVAQQNHYGEEAESQTTRIEKYTVAMMVLVVLFFVFSCVFSLSPQELADAKARNISILSYLGNKFDNPLMALLTPAVAFVAITKSFFGQYLGAREGLNGLISQHLRGQGKPVDGKAINRFSALFMVAAVWIAALLFIMPMYAIRKVPAMHKYAGQPGNVVVIFIGSVAISAIPYSLLSL